MFLESTTFKNLNYLKVIKREKIYILFWVYKFTMRKIKLLGLATMLYFSNLDEGMAQTKIEFDFNPKKQELAWTEAKNLAEYVLSASRKKPKNEEKQQAWEKNLKDTLSYKISLFGDKIGNQKGETDNYELAEGIIYLGGIGYWDKEGFKRGFGEKQIRKNNAFQFVLEEMNEISNELKNLMNVKNLIDILTKKNYNGKSTAYSSR